MSDIFELRLQTQVLTTGHICILGINKFDNEVLRINIDPNFSMSLNKSVLLDR